MDWTSLIEKEPIDAQAIVNHIQALPEWEERRRKYEAARQALGARNHSDLDALIQVARAGIAEGLRQAEAETDPEEARKRKDWANILAFNMSADLAECWPGDEVPRERRHFEAGRAAAEECIQWRTELGKGPWPFSIAWWVKGAHCLSLGLTDEAEIAFRNAQTFAEQAHVTENVSDFGVILACGYLGLALLTAGDSAGETLFDRACKAFESQVAAGGKEVEDAKFGLEQLNTMRVRLGRRFTAPPLLTPGCLPR